MNRTGVLKKHSQYVAVAVAALLGGWVAVLSLVGGRLTGAEPEASGEAVGGSAVESVAEENDAEAAAERESAATRWGQPKGHYLLREGMKLTGVVGKLTSEGGRLQFAPDAPAVRLTVLENAASGEVARLFEQGDESSLWEISGMITEFREANFILIDKATLRSSATAAVSDD